MFNSVTCVIVRIVCDVLSISLYCDFIKVTSPVRRKKCRIIQEWNMMFKWPFNSRLISQLAQKISLCTTSLVPEDLTPDSYQSRQVKSSAILVRVWLALSCGGWYLTFREGHIILSSCAAPSLWAANIAAIIRRFGDLRVCPSLADNCYDTFGVWISIIMWKIFSSPLSTCSVEADMSHNVTVETHPVIIPVMNTSDTLCSFSPADSTTRRHFGFDQPFI